MPLDLLVNGSIKKGLILKMNFSHLKLTKHSQIEVMDWNFYVKPINKQN